MPQRRTGSSARLRSTTICSFVAASSQSQHSVPNHRPPAAAAVALTWLAFCLVCNDDDDVKCQLSRLALAKNAEIFLMRFTSNHFTNGKRIHKSTKGKFNGIG